MITNNILFFNLLVNSINPFFILSFNIMENLYKNCQLCPRKCGINRNTHKGFCGVGPKIKLSSLVLHKGEEPPISGVNGSGTFFFSGCPLGCTFCQNTQISKTCIGKEITVEEFADLMLLVQKEGGHNVNFVTGTQFIPSIIQGIILARRNGLTIPCVWNTSGYETPESINLLLNYIDIFLPDCKTLNKEVSDRIFPGSNYYLAISNTLELMIKPVIIKNDLYKQGTIIRHLVLPGLIDNTREIIEYYAKNLRDKALLSIMVQYTPPKNVDLPQNYPWQMKEEGNNLTKREYNKIFEWLEEFNIEEGFIQDLSTKDAWLPDFTKKNPFPPKFSRVLWDWQSIN
jgi:putative pyruvate formate lyase activating enzyme